MAKIALELNRKRLQQVLSNAEQERNLKQKIKRESANLRKSFAKKWLSG